MEAGTHLTGRALYPRFSDAEFARRQRLIGEAMDPGGDWTRSSSMAARVPLRGPISSTTCPNLLAG